MELGIILSILGAGLTVLIPGIGSIIGVGVGGMAAAGLIAEEPEKFGKALLLQVLPGTQGIYGFLAAVLILQKIGVFGTELIQIDTAVGLQIFLACIPIMIGGLISAIFQAKVSIAGIMAVAKKGEVSGKAVILSAMVETYAVISLLATILIINGIKIG